jgi:hypothetical protein
VIRYLVTLCLVTLCLVTLCLATPGWPALRPAFAREWSPISGNGGA